MKLSIRARLGIVRWIGEQRGGLDESEVLAEAKMKTTVPQVELDQCLQHLGNGQMIIDDFALDKPGLQEIVFEKAERRQLAKMKDYKGFTADDNRWARGFISQIEESLIDAPTEISTSRKKQG